MSLQYQTVQWNAQKRRYDWVLAGGVGSFLLIFVGVTKALFPRVTDEILLIRGFGIAAFLLLHVILCIGPLCRLDRRFLPLLYNRRHAGVTMFLLALIHAILVVATYHAGGDVNPVLSIFLSSPLTPSRAGVPFQAFGFIALVILGLMAATSHDFWLANLSAPVWKSLHLLVYAAYGLLVLHVTFGVLQAEVSWSYALVIAIGLAVVGGLHLVASFREERLDRPSRRALTNEGFQDVCDLGELRENRGRIFSLSGERVAVFMYDGKVAAISNVCQHQNGPLGRGRSSMAVSPAHGMGISICQTPARLRRRSGNASRPSTFGCAAAGC